MLEYRRVALVLTLAFSIGGMIVSWWTWQPGPAAVGWATGLVVMVAFLFCEPEG